MNTLDFNTFISYLPDLTREQQDILRDKRLTDGTPVFENISLYEAYDLLSMAQRLSSTEGFIRYIRDNHFDTPEDIILEYPSAFDEERKNYEIRRKEDEMTTAVSDSIYKCNKCSRPVISQSVQTRGGDEGATVFLVCTSCNITRRI